MEQQQHPQTEYIYPQGAIPPANDSKAELLDKIKPEHAVEHIRQYLMGNVYDSIKQKWIPSPALQKLAITEFGASHICNLMYPASSQNSSLSNLKEERINKRLNSIIISLVYDMIAYRDEMGIQSTSHMRHLYEIVHTLVYVSLTQSENEGIRRLINSTISESRNVSTYGEERKEGFLRGMFRK